MLLQTDESFRRDLVSEAYREWRKAANAWSTFYGRVKQDPESVSRKQRETLRSLQRRLNQASDRYTRERLNAKQTRI